MRNIERLIPDNEGNHLVVALDFYDEEYKIKTLCLPEEFSDIEIADISIGKLNLEMPLGMHAFSEMVEWLIFQFDNHQNAIFTFIWSIDPMENNHKGLPPEEYRWRLFDLLYRRAIYVRNGFEIEIQDVIIGPDDFKSGARAFYRSKHAPMIHLIAAQLRDK